MAARDVWSEERRRGWRLDVRRGVEVLTWDLFAGHPVDAVVTTRHGGVSTGPYTSLNLGRHVGDEPGLVTENRTRAAATVGLSLDDLVFCRQSHGRAVAVVGDADRGRGARSEEDAVADTDALVTTTPGIGLVVMVADCVPIVLYDPGAGVLAAVHAGWRGTVAGVAAAAVDTMTALGAETGRILAGIGPAVAPDRYQVGPEVAVAAADAFATSPGVATAPALDEIVRPDGTGRFLFDLWAANRRLLLEAGLAADHIAVAALPTGDRFFSDRAVRPCGRFAALATLRPPAP